MVQHVWQAGNQAEVSTWKRDAAGIMNRLVAEELDATCPLGHTWRVSAAPAGGEPRESSCPICGSLATITSVRLATPEEVAESLPEIPGFELMEELGRGGMGVVYKARQQTPSRLVALKMMRGGGASSAEALARFRAEAEAVARLEHPHIVRIHSVGQQRDQSYLVLEYVAGGSLADRLRGEPQSPREAAAMIETLARSIHFAHQRQIIHRDLKPANVLLDGEGAPKITDFGLAKQLDADLAQTQTGEVLGTLAYMAPEQATGVTRNIGPPCDIHALGAMLYELLTGRRPYVGRDVMDSITLLTSAEPVPPRRLAPGVPRDLETICLKCLQKLPRERYASAAALADDLARYLAGEPIHARPAGPLERAQKWARRRPALALLLTCAMLVPLLAAAGFYWHGVQLGQQLAQTARQRARAEANLAKTQDKLDELLGELNSGALASLPNSSGVRTEMLHWALRLCDDLRGENPDNAHLRWQVARAERQTADIRRLLGEPDVALAAYNTAADALTALVESVPDEASYGRELATALNNRGLLQAEMDQSDASLRDLRDALALWGRLAEEQPEQVDYRRRLASTWSNLGLQLQTAGQPSEARAAFEQSLASLNHNSTPTAEEQATPLTRAALLVNFGRFQHDEGELAAAAHSFQAALAALHPLMDATKPGQNSPDPSSLPEARHAAATAHNNLAAVLIAQQMPNEARTELEQAIATFGQLAAEFPAQPGYRESQATAQLNLVGLLDLREDRAQAEALLDQVKATYEMLDAQEPARAEYRQGWAAALGQLARLKFLAGEQAEAEQALVLALLMQKMVVDDDNAQPDRQNQLALLEQTAGELLAARQDWTSAADHFANAIVAQRAAISQAPGRAAYRLCLRQHYEKLAEMRLSQGEIAAAALLAETLAAEFADQPAELITAAGLLARCIPLAVALKGEQKIAGQDVDAYCRELLAGGTFDSIRQHPDFQQLQQKKQPAPPPPKP